MLNERVDITEIMKDIQNKAGQKRMAENKLTAARASDYLYPELKASKKRLEEIHTNVLALHKYTKEHEDTALNPPVSLIQRCIRKLTKFIWQEQNEVNRSLNNNIHTLLAVQIELTSNLNKISDLMFGINERLIEMEKITEEKIGK
ncbi:MAG: hypothetical protein FWD38_00915 [Oscillospiraceae bacterium]|nr:hypothetical protein [Oscillospiraceae bacterium]